MSFSVGEDILFIGPKICIRHYGSIFSEYENGGGYIVKIIKVNRGKVI